jgi:glycosyltransferase involved in cell wall biosynthesis
VKVAYFSPLPPERSGISDYSALLLPALRERIDVEVVNRGQKKPPRGTGLCVYHVGNNPDVHGWIVDALKRTPGVVVLHDFVLHHLVAGLTLARKDVAGYLNAMEREAGLPGRLLALGVVDGCVPPLWSTRPEDFALAGDVLDLAREHGLIVHSEHVRERALATGFDGPIWRIPMPVWPAPPTTPAAVDGDPVIGSFGFLNANKRIPQLLEAFAALRNRHPRARLLLVGPEAPGLELERRVASLGLEDAVERHGYVDEAQFWSLLAACDIAVSLRWPTMGETSAGAIRVLSLAKPLIVSDVDAFGELPDDVVLKVAPDEREVETLTAALLALAEDPARREAFSEAARAYAAREHELGHVADLYVAALEEAAGGPAVREALLREVAERAAEVELDDPDRIAAALREVGLGR